MSLDPAHNSMSNASLGRPANTAVDKLRTDALATMDLTKIVRAYLGTLSDAATGYKAIILDKDTMRVASTLFGRSEFAEHNVVHVEKLEDQETNKEHTELKVRLPWCGMNRHQHCEHEPSSTCA